MRRMIGIAVMLAAPAAAADLTVAKTATVVTDGTPSTKPRALPGATVSYSLTVTNPLANTSVTIRNLQIVDTIDPAMQVSLADLGATGSGPVEFTDGGVLGLLGSGLTLAGIDYSKDGRTFTYQPVPVAGVDPAVRAIRFRLSGTQNTGGSFRLRYRAIVR